MTGSELRPGAHARLEIVHAVLAFFAMYLLTSAGVVILGQELEPGESLTRRQLEVTLVVQTVASLVVIAASTLHPTATPLLGRGRVLSSIGLYFAFLVVWVPVSFVLVPLAWEALGGEIVPQPHLEYFTGGLDAVWVAAMLTAVCFVGPLFEELVFRGYLQTGMRELYGKRAAIFWPGLLFGLVHVGAGYHAVLPLAMIGWLLGWLRERTGGLLAPFLVHALHNSWTVGLVMARPEVLTTVYETR